MRKTGEDGNKKTWISREQKELFTRNEKSFFIGFEALSFGEKMKIWFKKIADASFNLFFSFYSNNKFLVFHILIKSQNIFGKTCDN